MAEGRQRKLLSKQAHNHKRPHADTQWPAGLLIYLMSAQKVLVCICHRDCGASASCLLATTSKVSSKTMRTEPATFSTMSIPELGYLPPSGAPACSKELVSNRLQLFPSLCVLLVGLGKCSINIHKMYLGMSEWVRLT